MRFLPLTVLLLAASLVVGCNPPKDKVTTNSTGGQAPAPEKPGVSEPKSDGPGETKPDPTVEAPTPDPAKKPEPVVSAETGKPIKPAKPFEIQSAADGTWKKSNVQLATLFKQIDDRFYGLKETAGFIHVVYQGHQGDRGEARVDAAFLDKGTFRFEVPVIERTFYKNEVRSYKGTQTNRINTKWNEPKPTWARANKPLSPTKIQDLPLNFGTLMFDGFISGTRPWTAIATELGKPNSKLKPQLEEREVLVQGRKIKYYRLLVEGKPNASSPEVDMEIVINELHKLPVTVRSVLTYPDKQQTKVYWTAKWKFNDKLEKTPFELPDAKAISL